MEVSCCILPTVKNPSQRHKSKTRFLEELPFASTGSFRLFGILRKQWKDSFFCENEELRTMVDFPEVVKQL